MEKEINFLNDVKFGKGVLSEPFSYVVWYVELDAEGNLKKSPKDDKKNWSISDTIDKETKGKSAEDFALEQNRRTITFRINFEGMDAYHVVAALHAGQTTLAKQFYNNSLSANSKITFDEAEELITRAGKKKEIILTAEDFVLKPRNVAKLETKSMSELESEKAKLMKRIAMIEAVKARKVEK